MDEKTVLELLDQAIKTLLDKDEWLLRHALSEPCISHKLAEHLQPLFKEYNVDCEYNGNIVRQDGIKRISMPWEDLKKATLLRKEELELENEVMERAVLPDIVIHRRGTNQHNLSIIEVKKDTSSVTADYDYMKLCAYTSLDIANDLRYQIGIFIRFSTGEGFKFPQLILFKNGEQHIEKS